MLDRQTEILTTTSTAYITAAETQKSLDSDLYFGIGVDTFFLLIISVMLSVSELVK